MSKSKRRARPEFTFTTPEGARIGALIDEQLTRLKKKERRAYLERLRDVFGSVVEAYRLVDTLPDPELRELTRNAFAELPMHKWLKLARLAVQFDRERRMKFCQTFDSQYGSCRIA